MRLAQLCTLKHPLFERTKGVLYTYIFFAFSNHFWWYKHYIKFIDIQTLTWGTCRWNILQSEINSIFVYNTPCIDCHKNLKPTSAHLFGFHDLGKKYTFSLYAAWFAFLFSILKSNMQKFENYLIFLLSAKKICCFTSDTFLISFLFNTNRKLALF